MSTINAESYYNRVVVQKAIARSLNTNEIVTLECVRETTWDAVCALLREDCVDWTDVSASHREYWGEESDGAKWRVHVSREIERDDDATEECVNCGRIFQGGIGNECCRPQ